MNKKILTVLVLVFALTFSTQALASLTFTSNAITGTTASTLDVGAGNALSLQTTGNGAITTGSGLFTTGGSLVVTGNTTTPLIIGGTTTTSPLTLKTTTGVGTTGADIIFQTGNNGATEAMRILNSGNVGIGTTTPSVLLDLVGSGDLLRLTHSSNQPNGIILRQTGVGADSPRIFFLRNNEDSGNSIMRRVTGLSFNTGGIPGTTTGSARLIIGDTGNVGIGEVTILGSLLAVKGGVAIGETTDYSQAAAPIGGMIVKGNVGIGVTAPGAKLDINSNSFILETAQTPASASATCTTGMISWDTGFVYVCTATNTWKRSALATW